LRWRADPVGFVVSLNLKRRHLSEGQRAMVAAKMANSQAGTFSGNQHVPSANLQTPAISQTKAADLLQVSTRYMATAIRDKVSRYRLTAPAMIKAPIRMAIGIGAAAKAPITARMISPPIIRDASFFTKSSASNPKPFAILTPSKT